MSTKSIAKQFQKKFKRLSKRNQNSLTFEEKNSNLSAKDAVNVLLNKSVHQNDDGNFKDIVHAFANKRDIDHHQSYNKKLNKRKHKIW